MSTTNVSRTDSHIQSHFLFSFSAALNTSNLGDHILEYRIARTPLVLAFNLKNTQLNAQNLYNTLYKTQTRVRVFEMAVPGVEQLPLYPTDNPYMSLPADSLGAFFGLTHWPADITPLLTYGMVDMVLTGVLNVLVDQRRFCAATFLVKHDLWNHVGIGRVEEKEMPGLLSNIGVARGAGREKY